MKATGVIRRIDDLGRIVIPKEIRKSFKINEGDSLEIFVDNNQIILKKYSLLDNMVIMANKLVESVKATYRKNILITDKNNVIACSNELSNNYLNSELVNSIKDKLQSREEFLSQVPSNIITKLDLMESYFMVPIIVNSDCIGSVIMIDDNFSDEDRSLIRLIASILIKNVEE